MGSRTSVPNSEEAVCGKRRCTWGPLVSLLSAFLRAKKEEKTFKRENGCE